MVATRAAAMRRLVLAAGIVMVVLPTNATVNRLQNATSSLFYRTTARIYGRAYGTYAACRRPPAAPPTYTLLQN